MRGDELLDRMGDIDPAYVAAADQQPSRRRRRWPGWIAAAACLCAIVAVGASQFDSEQLARWHEGLAAEAYFANSKVIDKVSSVAHQVSDSVAAEDLPWSETRSFSDQRASLEEEGVLPPLDDHLSFYCEGYYNEDGSLYGLSVKWSQRGETTQEYSDLEVLAGSGEVIMPEDTRVDYYDENHRILRPRRTEIERDGVRIVGEGLEDAEKSLTFEKDGVWYKITGSWNDSYENVVALLDWFWAHPLDLSRFSNDAGTVLTEVSLSEAPTAFVDQLPDFAAYGYAPEEGSEPLLVLADGAPYSMCGTYRHTTNGDVVSWFIDTAPDTYDLQQSLGEVTTLDEARVVETMAGQGYVPFTMAGCLITVAASDAAAAWPLIASLQG